MARICRLHAQDLAGVKHPGGLRQRYLIERSIRAPGGNGLSTLMSAPDALTFSSAPAPKTLMPSELMNENLTGQLT